MDSPTEESDAVSPSELVDDIDMGPTEIEKVDKVWAKFKNKDWQPIGDWILTLLANAYSGIAPKYKDVEEAEKMADNTTFQTVLKQCYKSGSFKELCRLKILREPHESAANAPTSGMANDLTDNLAQEATTESWNRPFKGNAADVLIETLSSFLDRSRTDVYASYAAIVNSSGMGKSRLVDELGKRVVVIFMCLREDTIGSKDQEDVAIQKSLGLLYALCTVTLSRLQQIEAPVETKAKADDTDDMVTDTSPEIDHGSDVRRMPEAAGDDGAAALRSEEQMDVDDAARPAASSDDPLKRVQHLASTFRKLMVEGKSFDQTSEYRRHFYNKVIESAKEHAKTLKEDPIKVKEAAWNLCKFLDKDLPTDDPDKKVDPSEEDGPRRPLVVFSFDEAHVLTVSKNGSSKNGSSWSVFSKLRGALQYIGLPIFSLFLSTMGNFQEFSPEAQYDKSARVRNKDLDLLPSITEVGFDELAMPAKEGEITLAKVSTDEFMCHLGRPLFGSRYDAGDYRLRNRLQSFAQDKLTMGGESSEGASLARLSVRLALEFRPKTKAERDIEARQVERHMRVCLYATRGFQSMVTVAASEPFLAEAAGHLDDNTPRTLAQHLDKSGLDKGWRGELLAMLLIMTARDKTAESEGRVISVQQFLKNLLKTNTANQLEDLLPHFARDSEGEKKFSETFKDSRIWFNHFVKVADFKVINVRHLWGLVIRGAAILCADNQCGIDILVPFIFGKKKNDKADWIGPDNVSAILFQVKNAVKFTDKVYPVLFHPGMDPFQVGLFSNPTVPLPVIRVVMALSPPTSATHGVELVGPPARVPRRRKSKPTEGYTAYDIWCTGYGESTFGVSSKKNDEYYKAMLGRNVAVQDAYDLKDDPDFKDDLRRKRRSDIRRQMHPATATDAEDVHFSGYLTRASQGTVPSSKAG